MFGFSLPKLLILVAIVVVVWQGFKIIQKRQEVQARGERDRVRESRRTGGRRDAPPVEDMVRCEVCDAFVPATGAADCGRSGCPYA